MKYVSLWKVAKKKKKKNMGREGWYGSRERYIPLLKNYSLCLSSQKFKPATSTIPIWSSTKNILAFKTPLKSFHQRRVSTAGHAHAWSSRAEACPTAHRLAPMAGRRRMSRSQCHISHGKRQQRCPAHSARPTLFASCPETLLVCSMH